MEEEECNTCLALGIGGGDDSVARRGRNHDRKPPIRFDVLFPPHAKEEEEEELEKKRRSMIFDEDQVISPKDMIIGGNNGVSGGMRKKLRLTEAQSALLESSFREHHTLNLTRKQELVERLSLTPRQVEVWFQNRRARTKLKQTEINCELLKRCCERLSDENRRLKRELQELRLTKARSPSCMAICQFCEGL